MGKFGKLGIILLIFILKSSVFVPSVFAIYTEGGEDMGVGSYVPGEVIVKYKKGKTPQDLKAAAALRQERADEFLGSLINKWEDYKFSSNGEKPPEEVLELARDVDKNLKVNLQKQIFDEFYIVGSEEDLPPASFISRYERLDNVELVEPNYLYHLMIVEPNDEHYASGKMWGMEKINAPSAWDKSTGSSSVKAAVIDAGIDPEHEDLAGNIVDFRDIAGCGGRYGTGHGTHTSGTVGAVGNNETGVVGINWTVGIVGINASCSDSLSVGLVSQGINYAVDKGAKVINLSLGGGYSSVMDAAIGKAEDSGVLVVVSAGNTAGSYADQFYPARDPRVITVSATGPNDELARYSSYGNAVDVAAPGGNPPGGSSTCAADASDCIVSTWLDNGYAAIAGTSMAAPHVTGLVALVYSANSGLSAAEVKDIIYQTADDLGEPGKDARFGHGRINAGAALAAAAGGGGEPTVTGQPTVTGEPTITGEPTVTVQPTVSPADCALDGDYNGDGTVDGADYEEWKDDYIGGTGGTGSRGAALSCFEYWRRAGDGRF